MSPMAAPDRLLPLVGAFNFRDLGGYPTVDGRITRWGRLFRSDTLHGLTDSDVEVLHGIGLTTVIDLRRPAELETSGRGPLVSEQVEYRHLPLIVDEGEQPGVPAEDQENLAQIYKWFLEVGRRSLVEALTMVGEPQNHPLVFHCTAGKDRTGVLAALVLDILGVERNVIVEDYVLTASRMDLVMARIKREPEAEALIAEVPQFLFRAEAETMETFIDELHRNHGGAREWALGAGVSTEALDTMTEVLIT
jgi:protein-tyrosine phosphatase